MRRNEIVSALVLACLTAASCGLGSVGAATGLGSGGSSNAPAALSGLAVEGPKTAPATLRFTLADPEGDPTRVELLYRVPGGSLRRVERILAGMPTNPAVLAASPAGQQHSVVWDFAAEPDLPPDASFVPDVLVRAEAPSASEELSTGLGNDPPVIEVETPPGQVSGVVPLRFTVSDSSGDVVRIRAEFRSSAGGQAAEWRIARPAGLAPSAPTPEWAFDGVVAQPAGSSLVFFWDTDRDFFQLVGDVELRLTAVDPVVAGEPTVTEPFRVHNNEPPTIILQNDQVIANPDGLRGIPIPYILRDRESDEALVVFQWRRPGGTFPTLPGTRSELEGILADPVQRREKQICNEYPRSFEGRVEPIDDERVRLPELGSSASALLAAGLAGRDLEILRPKSVLEEASAGWTANPLSHPVGVLALGDGLEALVLDRPGPGSWRLARVVLATGEVSCVVATGSGGDPTALAAEVGTPSWPQAIDSVLVASYGAGGWRVERVTLPSCPAPGLVTPLVDADGSTENEPIRGLASQSLSNAVATLGSSLVRLCFLPGEVPRQEILFDDLETPWGVALDFLQPHRLYLAEHTASTSSGMGRIVLIDLDGPDRRPLTATWLSGGDGDPLPRPRGLTLEARGTRLVFGCDVTEPSRAHALRALDLHGGNRVHSIREGLAAPVAAVAAGPDNLRLAAQPALDELLVAGGVEQRRRILGSDLPPDVPLGSPGGLGIATVEGAFEPALQHGSSWRIRGDFLTPRGSPEGSSQVFVWDSRDAQHGSVHLKATAADLVLGSSSEGSAAKAVRSNWDAPPVELAVPGTNERSSVVVDLDGNGFLDVVAANRSLNRLSVTLQESPGTFSPNTIELGGPGVTDSPSAVAVGDFSGNGRLDIIVANSDSHSLAIFTQDSPGTFNPIPLVLGGPGVNIDPRHLVAADIDGNGLMDVACANLDNITIFLQDPAGSFPATPIVLGDSKTTDGPTWIEVADVDGNGRLDVVSANRVGNDLTVFFQSERGWATEALFLGGIGLADNPVRVQLVDIDGDGLLDLVSTNSGNFESGSSVTIFHQRMPSVFDPDPTLFALPYWGGGSLVRRTAIADVDRDGLQDLVVTSPLEKGARVYLQVAPGIFGATSLLLSASEPFWFPNAVTVADMDGDGLSDVVISGWGNQSGIAIFFQRGAGTFDPDYLFVSCPSYVDFITVDDLDRNGLLDIVDHNGARVYFQRSPILESVPHAFPGLALGGGSVRSIALADLARGGLLDVVLATSGESRLRVFRQEVPGVFSEALSLAPSGNFSPQSVLAVDLDADGRVDLIAGDYYQFLVIFMQNPAGGFTGHFTLGNTHNNSAPMSVAVADVDGNGLMDLVAASSGGLFGTGDISVFYQDAPGAFQPTPLVLVQGNYNSCAAGDVNGDGLVDIVAAPAMNSGLHVFLQNVSGNFGGMVLGKNVVLNPQQVLMADIDLDGRLDIVSANLGSHTVTVFFQESPGVFSAAPVVLGGPGVSHNPRSIAVADVFGNGYPDIVVAHASVHRIMVYQQVAPRVFSTEPLRLGSPGVTDLPQFVLAADLDGDGDVDVISTNGGSNNSTIFFGGR